jgi:hypothetical protein
MGPGCWRCWQPMPLENGSDALHPRQSFVSLRPMKKHLLRPFAVLLGVALAAAAPSVIAQDDSKPESAEKEESEEKGEPEGGEDAEPQEFDAEEFKQQLKEQEEEEKAQVATMMKVFKPLEAEWTGTEKIEHEDEPLKALDKSWKDEWKGFYTFGGRYFEMTGQASGENSSSYRWICTWDAAAEVYRAWYFGDNAQNQYVGQLSGDGKHVVWKTRGQNGSTSQFEMIADGDRVTCRGMDRAPGGRPFSKQSSSYTRKKLEL